MKSERISWFLDAKFGIFLHWGLYAIPGGQWNGQHIPYGTEWIMRNGKIPLAEYRKLAEQFNPIDFDAEAWVRQIIGYGARYVCFTAKHHDGFALYDSRADDYNIMHTPFGRDVLAELAGACQKYGLRLCVYYSQMQDWAHPDGDGNTWDYDPEAKRFDRYFYGKVIPQVAELLTGYGKISMIWFDTPYDMPPEKCLELRETVKRLQPDCLINGRIGYGLGDYRQMTDNCIPARPYNGPWETPMTLNDTWGYSHTDAHWKSSDQVIEKLVDIVSKGGNLLLNIGPDSNGRFPARCRETLSAVGEWLRENGESIYETRPTIEMPYVLPFGGYTQKPSHLYLHVQKYPRSPYVIALFQLDIQVERVTLLRDGRELRYTQTYEQARNENRFRIFLPQETCPSEDTVIDVQYSGELRAVSLETPHPWLQARSGAQT